MEKHKCKQVAYAGDIFNTWREPAELVNFVMEHLPHGYAIPGQHDLPHHRIEDVKKTPYWTLVRAGILEHIPAGQMRAIWTGKICLWGFPWGAELTSPDLNLCVDKNALHVAVIHSYVWLGSNRYPDAPPQQHFSKYLEPLTGYDTLVFGDNHLGFETSVSKNPRKPNSGFVSILNNGVFVPRNADEQDYEPCVGLVHTTGAVSRVKLDTSEDKWIDAEQQAEEVHDPDLEELMSLLKQTRHRPDFAKVLIRSLDDSQLKAMARMVILESLEDKK
jgi:hypothetical protein